MNSQTQLAPASAAELAGDLAPFVAQLGSPGDAHSLGAVLASLKCPRALTAASVAAFLDAYRAQVLVPIELPAIFKAWQHASRFEARELIALDRQLALEPGLDAFAAASLVTGRHQLRRLRPLRDQKLVQRYLKSIESGEARGWHTLVYGVTLAIYSFPPRQGLAVYARQTLAGFARSAGRGLPLAEADLNALIEEACAGLPAAINSVVAAAADPPFGGAAPRPSLSA